MAAAIPGLAAEFLAPAQFDLPPAVSSCEGISVDDIIGETTGSWTTSSFDGKLHCVAETNGANRISVVIGGLASTDEAVIWTNTVTDEMLEHGAFDQAYPIQMRSDDLDRGYSSFGVSVLTDYEAGLPDGETISADITVGSRGRFVALLSVMGPIADDVNLYTSDTAEILGSLLTGIESDFDPAVREENVEEVVATFFGGPEISLAGLADDFGNYENIDIAAAMAAAAMPPASLSADGGWLDNDDTLLNCSFYTLDSDGEPSVDLGPNPLRVEVWNGNGDVPWADWETEDHEVIDTLYGTLR